MRSAGRIEEAFFFTATILEWKYLLRPHKYKDVVIESLRFLVKDGRIYVFAFVIMDNHMHVIWQLRNGQKQEKVQQSFLKYTAQQIKFDLIANHPQVLERFRVNAKDRVYQFWERNSLSIALWTQEVLLQKLRYIHLNPVRAGICGEPHQYHYSSTFFYETGENDFGFLMKYERSGWDGR